jgi:hypothetical protein
MEQLAVVADLGAGADDKAHTVPDLQPPTDGGTWVDVDAREHASPRRHEQRGEAMVPEPESVSSAVRGDGPDRRIG